MNNLKDIVIVGGGSAGWLTAAYLSNRFPFFNITIIDKEYSTRVGVGEATLLNFKNYMNDCGFDFNDWFKNIDATFKSGILFTNWLKKGEDVWHPFHMNPYVDNGYFKKDYWSDNQDLDFKKYGLSVYETSVIENKVYNELNYGFHIDCLKLVDYIKDSITTRQNVNFVIGEVKNLTENELILKDNNIIQGDLFIDCTGFSHLLNENPQKNDLRDRLICDTAIAGHIKYENKEKELTPYVKCEAVDIGWVWNIPVKNRIGSGIVFNKEITDIESAKKYFINHLDNRIDEKDLKVLNWSPYYNNNIWHDNVVSIGLSAGFIEPLESTGLALIMQGVISLSSLIQKKYYNKNDIDLYNIELKSFFENAIDFVNMHYTNTERQEPFWLQARSNLKISDTQKMYEKMLLNDEPNLPFQDSNTGFFGGNNWSTWLIQLKKEVNPRNINIEKKNVLKHFVDSEKNNADLYSVPHTKLISYMEKI